MLFFESTVVLNLLLCHSCIVTESEFQAKDYINFKPYVADCKMIVKTHQFESDYLKLQPNYYI